MKHFSLITAIILILSSISANGQTARLYSSSDGLANSHIYDIFQDSKGFIWISTENGLSRFDGIKFFNTSFDRTRSNSIASNTVRTVLEDSTGRFWVGTASGLQTFDTDYNTYHKINLEDWSVPDSDQHITMLMELVLEGERKILASSSGHGIYILNIDD